jgi:integrase/recombinase XerD
LIKERQLSASSVNVAVNAVRFLYGITLARNTEALTASVPHMKHPIRRAEVYARSELEAILSAPSQPRDRAFLMTVYACGLRISEARDLKTSDIDRARMQLRVRNGKGAKGRVLPLSKRLLKELVDYWRAQRQAKAGHDSPWLFLGERAGEPVSLSGVPHRVCWSLGATDSRAIWESPPSYILGDKSSISIPIFTALLPAER